MSLPDPSDARPRLSESSDLSALIAASKVTIEPEEHPDERAARLRREERRDQREHLLFLVVLLGLSLIAVVTGYLALLAESPDPEVREASRIIFTTITSGGIGFLFGRALPGR